MVTSFKRGEPMGKPLKFCTIRSRLIGEMRPGAPNVTFSPGKGVGKNG